MQTSRLKLLPFFMWLTPVLFFAYQFILRLWPSLMMHELMQQLAIDATGFGLVAAFYYYGYASMQIPIAILLDRYGARYVIFACAVLAGVSMMVFSHTDSWYMACLSRFLVGAGSAVGFLGVSKVVSEWFPQDQYAKMIGISFTVGLMGAIYGGKPVSLLVESYSSGAVSFVLACASITLGITAYLFIRKPKNLQVPESDSFRLLDMKTLLSRPTVWILATANLLMVGALEGFADVWGVSYLMLAYTYDKASAAELVSFIFFGMLLGGPFLAAMSRHLGNYLVIVLCGLGLSFAFFLLLFGYIDGWYGLSTLFFGVGIMCCYQVIVFAAGAYMVSVRLLSVTIAFLNCVNMLGGSFFHTVIGSVMDFFWAGVTGSDGLPSYSVETYRFALLVIPICSLVGSVLVGFLGLRSSQKRLLGTYSKEVV